MIWRGQAIDQKTNMLVYVSDTVMNVWLQQNLLQNLRGCVGLLGGGGYIMWVR
jgi:hypothetical protein